MKQEQELRKKEQAKKERKEREEWERQEWQKKRRQFLERHKKQFAIGAIILVVLIICSVVTTTVIVPNIQYGKAESLYEAGNFEEAEAIFTQLGDFKDSAQRVVETKYARALSAGESGEFENALKILESLTEYEPAQEALKVIHYKYANKLLEDGAYELALEEFQQSKEYRETASILDSVVPELVELEYFDLAIKYLYLHDDDDEIKKQVYYEYLVWQMEHHRYENTAETFQKIEGYRDTLTNDMFAGAQLLAAQSMSWNEIEIYGLSVTAVGMSLVFTSKEMTCTFTGLTSSLYSVDDPVTISESWEFRFEGRDIYYLSADGQYLKGGSIGAFSVAEDEENTGTVVLTFDFPGMMSVDECVFEYEIA